MIKIGTYFRKKLDQCDSFLPIMCRQLCYMVHWYKGAEDSGNLFAFLYLSKCNFVRIMFFILHSKLKRKKRKSMIWQDNVLFG